MSAIKSGAIMVALSTLLAAACSSTGEEPSPTSPPASDPIVIRLGTGDPRGLPDTLVVEGFADAVEQLSDGAMRVEVVWAAGGDTSVPDGFEKGVVQLVQDGELDLGLIAARAWDTVGVKSFQALQAPFLITDQELLTEVLASPMSDEMLAGLDDAGVVGLGVFPDGLRYPLGYTAPMTSLQDFDGADIRLVPSEATDALVRALGGRPVYGLSGDALDAAIANGDVDGTESPCNWPQRSRRRDPSSPATWCCSPRRHAVRGAGSDGLALRRAAGGPHLGCRGGVRVRHRCDERGLPSVLRYGWRGCDRLGG